MFEQLTFKQLFSIQKIHDSCHQSMSGDVLDIAIPFDEGIVHCYVLFSTNTSVNSYVVLHYLQKKLNGVIPFLTRSIVLYIDTILDRQLVNQLMRYVMGLSNGKMTLLFENQELFEEFETILM